MFIDILQVSGWIALGLTFLYFYIMANSWVLSSMASDLDPKKINIIALYLLFGVFIFLVHVLCSCMNTIKDDPLGLKLIPKRRNPK